MLAGCGLGATSGLLTAVGDSDVGATVSDVLSIAARGSLEGGTAGGLVGATLACVYGFAGGSVGHADDRSHRSRRLAAAPVSDEHKRSRGTVGAPIWESWEFWLWLLVGLIVYFALKASGLSSLGPFLLALLAEVAGHTATVVLRRVTGTHRSRIRWPHRRDGGRGRAGVIRPRLTSPVSVSTSPG